MKEKSILLSFFLHGASYTLLGVRMMIELFDVEVTATLEFLMMYGKQQISQYL